MDIMKTVATTLHARLSHSWDAEPVVVRITTDASQLNPEKHALLLDSTQAHAPDGFACYFFRSVVEHPAGCPGPFFQLPGELQYLRDGDILRLNPKRREAWVMYRANSPSNSILLTERCNSWCVMCSQPPKSRDERSLVQEWLDAIPLMAPSTKEIGITGGEPTLLSDEFLNVVRTIKEHLPETALHVLSNGRMFNYLSLASAIAAVAPPDIMIGIPLYSDIAWQHDFVVQSPKAFDQTVRGILNLARCQIPVEIRVVTHRYSVPRLVPLAEFIARNLPFVHHVALMGLEPIGFGQANFDALWIDPIDYQQELSGAVRILESHGISVSIYNHQLCVLPESLWTVACQSISDWKNIYLAECTSCSVRHKCGGFFHSSTVRHSRRIIPVHSPPELSHTT
jgi:His-Xaa-Ser system radical SAM maturase HxsC